MRTINPKLTYFKRRSIILMEQFTLGFFKTVKRKDWVSLKYQARENIKENSLMTSSKGKERLISKMAMFIKAIFRKIVSKVREY